MLADRDRRILEFEAAWQGAPGAKEQQIRARFGMSATVYHAAVSRLLDDPDALRHDPVNVQRDAREHARRARQLG